MVIYKTTNNITGKSYVGKDKYNNPQYLGSGKILRQSIRKHGRDVFTKTILEETNDNNREKYWINYHNTLQPYGYNIATGGEGGDTFTHASTESKNVRRYLISKRTKLNILKGVGITSKSEKGKHITESYPEIKDKWIKNYYSSLKTKQERRANGEWTEGEKNWYINMLKFVRSPDERLSRSNRATGIKNSQYKGPYIVIDPHGIEAEYEFIKDIPMSMPTISKLIKSGKPNETGYKWKGWSIKIKPSSTETLKTYLYDSNNLGSVESSTRQL